MKLFKIFLFLFIVAVLIINTALIVNTYTLTDDHSVTIHGTSNLHAWDESVQVVSGNGIVNWNKDGSFDLEAINITMNVNSIKSDMGSVMNSNTYKALKADKYPEIIFKLNGPVKSIPVKSTKNSFAIKGTLTIAGVTKPVNIQATISIEDHNKLTFEGTQSVKMTDYGIDPPTAIFGTLKTGNEIIIRFKTNFINN